MDIKNQELLKKILTMANEDQEKITKQLQDPKVLSNFIKNILEGNLLNGTGALAKNNMLTMIIADSIMTNYDFNDKTKEELINVLNTAYEQKEMPNKTIKKLTEVFQGDEELAEDIKYMETMQASNLSAWAQSMAEGAKYFIIDFDERGCENCKKEYAGKIYPIERLDMIPPIHWLCSCVPMFFFDKEDAIQMSEEILKCNSL